MDCGLPAENSPYTDRETGLVFSSDEEFISSGNSSRVQKDDIGDYKPHNVLRYFPDGIRNCYDIKVKQDTNYLIRAEFVYGNYDGLNIMPRFNLYIGPNMWTVVGNQTKREYEIFHMAKSNSLHICLVKIGPTTPFISSLELRPLASPSYLTHLSASLKLNLRWSMISSGETIR